MAKLNFPDPAVTQTYSAAGTTWTWNSTLGVWSAIPGDAFTEADADGRYLKLDASNDPVTGTCEFASDLILDSITSAPALGTDADGKIIATSGGGSSQWTDTTEGIYYSSGKVGIGSDSPDQKLTVKDGSIVISGQANQLYCANLTSGNPEATFFIRNDGDNTWFMLSDPATTPQFGYNSLRPLRINNETGLCTINGSLTGNVTGNVSGSSGSCTGNSATATTATNANKIKRTQITTGNTSAFRLLLGESNNGDGYRNCYVLTDRTGPYYTPSTNTIAGLTQINANASTATTATNCSRSVVAGNGLTGGGALTANRTLTVKAANSTINVASTGISVAGGNVTAGNATNCSRTISASNGLTGGGQLNANRTISGVNASTSAKGVVQLSTSTSSTSTSLAATASAAKAAYDRAASYAPSKTGSGASGTWGISISGAVNNTNYNVNNTNTGTIRLMFTGSSYPSVPASNGTGSNGWCFNPGGSAFNNYYNTNSAKTSLWLNRQGNTTGKFIQFRYGAGNLSTTGERGNIRLTDSGNKTAYNTTSDYRLKSNVAPMTGAIDEVKQLKPCTWTWKSNDADGVGFIAHELQEVFPSAVCGEKDATVAIGTLKNSSGEIVAQDIENDKEDFCCYLETDTDENGVSTMETHTWEQTGERDEFQCVDYGLVTPLLTAALKEAIAKIEDLEGRLAALEGANE